MYTWSWVFVEMIKVREEGQRKFKFHQCDLQRNAQIIINDHFLAYREIEIFSRLKCSAMEYDRL